MPHDEPSLSKHKHDKRVFIVCWLDETSARSSIWHLILLWESYAQKPPQSTNNDGPKFSKFMQAVDFISIVSELWEKIKAGMVRTWMKILWDIFCDAPQSFY